jgi:polyisoprenoid-binding protein YceI
MKHRSMVIALAFAAPLAAQAAPETYRLDPRHTFTYFSVEHFGLSNQYGRFDRNAGRLTLDRAAHAATLDVTVDAGSVTTADPPAAGGRSRDDMLRSSDFFNAAEFSQATFKSTRVAFSGDTPTAVEGNLTLLGTTRPLTLHVDRFKCNAAQGPRKERCGGNATAAFKRSDFGMKFGMGSIGDEVTLMIVFEGDKE